MGGENFDSLQSYTLFDKASRSIVLLDTLTYIPERACDVWATIYLFIKAIKMSNSSNSQAPGQNKAVTIIINGRPREVVGKSLSYAEVVKLAFPDDPSNQGIDFTVAYANPHGKDGELVAGQEVHVKEGMVFNVTKTNRS